MAAAPTTPGIDVKNPREGPLRSELSRERLEQPRSHGSGESVISSGCHCTAITHQSLSVDSIPSMTPSGERAVTAHPSRDAIDGLMMKRIHVSVFGSDRVGDERAGIDGDRVGPLIARSILVVSDVGLALRRNVLHQRSAESDVQDLNASANRENRHVALPFASWIKAASVASRAGLTESTFSWRFSP